MHILLPPSEGKTAPAAGPKLDYAALLCPQLGDARARVVKELVEVSCREDGARVLGVGARVEPEVLAQRRLCELPCAPAREVYTGVLYEAAQLHAGDDVFIFSGLFGVTSGEDLIPAYRLAMGAKLPELGSVKAYWKRVFAQQEARRVERQAAGEQGGGMAQCVGNDGQDIVDMRSEAYQVTQYRDVPWWTVRVLNSDSKVVSHMAKRYRGRLTRALLDAQKDAVGGEPAGGRGRNVDVAEVARTIGEVSVEAADNRRVLTLAPYGA